MDLTEKSNLNRSFSFPDIHLSYLIGRRVVVQEMCEQSHESNFNSPLIRQYSCEELYCDSINRSRFVVRTRQSLLPSKKIYDETPMDVDLSDSSDEFEKENLQTNVEQWKDSRDKLIEHKNSENLSIQRNVHGTYGTNLREKYSVDCSHKSFIAGHKVSLTILFGIILVLIYQLIFMSESEKLLNKQNDLIKNVVHEVEKNVLYQDAAVQVVTKNLWFMDVINNNKKKILLFIGSTGVGKSYTANLIRKNFPLELVHDLNFQHLNRRIPMSQSDKCNLIVIDNLRPGDSDNVINFINELPDNCMLIIPIFNIQEIVSEFSHVINNNHVKAITNEFNKIGGAVEVATFDVIKRNDLTTWLEKQLINRNIIRNRDIIINSILEEHDVEYNGFKGIHAKLNLIEV